MRVRGDDCLGGECFMCNPEGDACWGQTVGVGGLVLGLYTKRVYVCGCVRLGRRVNSRASRCAGGRRGPERCARLFLTPGDLGRDRER